MHQTGTTVDVALLKQNECFGELALLTGETRTANVIALDEQTTVLRFSRERFNALLKQHTVALALPLAAVVLNAASPNQAFAGFSHPSWFLVLGVFAISAAISKTGRVKCFHVVCSINFADDTVKNKKIGMCECFH